MERFSDVNMAKYTTFRAGGNADELVIPENVTELMDVLKELDASGKEYAILGNGSNTLIKDGGYHGTILKLGDAFSRIEVDGEYIECGAATLMSQVSNAALNAELSGFENLSGIPGSLGGAVFMNAGAYGTEIKDIIVSAEVVKKDGSEVYTLAADELGLGYRTSAVQKSGDIVVSVKIKLTKGDHDEISAKIKEVTQQRVTKQPLKYPSAGSFFKRPEGHFAGKLIEDAGLKGLRVGDAQISELHAGFMINLGHATATDITDLMQLVQNTVYDKFSVKLEPEVRILGE